jgi:leucyl aminopeptidase
LYGIFIMALEFSLNASAAHLANVDCVVVGCYSDTGLSAAASALDAESKGRLSALFNRGDLPRKAGQTLVIHDLDGITAARVLVVGLGEQKKLGAGEFGKAVEAAVGALRNGPSRTALMTLDTLDVSGRDADWALSQAVVVADRTAYRYSRARPRNGADKTGGLASLHFMADASRQHALDYGLAVAAGIELARELGNLPPNICNPAYIADQAQRLADAHPGATCEVLERAEMERLGMGALLAVARGSANPPKLIVLRWTGAGETKPYALVGKGITFDSGGINLKVQGGIEEMKFDMCGAATVIGAFATAVKLKLPINLITIVAAVENMTDGDAYRPSDVLDTMSGKTVEVLNTDAEGRLILCDALTYCQRFEPEAIVDVATLTGACVVALGKHATGLMSKHDDLAQELLDAGTAVHDRAWRLPIWDDYQPLLDSAFADMANIGSKWGGAITAGCFLSRFTEGRRWAHLDIAGSAWDEGRKGMATGRPVALLVRWLADRAGNRESGVGI